MKNRKVFARFFTDPASNITYRLNTVLQFGNCWDIIGSAILLNPGSATISSELLSSEELQHLNNITGTKNGWNIVDYSRDTTIRDSLPRIFNGYFANINRELNGIILLYNLFNLKETDSEKAKSTQAHVCSEYLYTSSSDIELINNSPIVFLGWGKDLPSELNTHAKHLFSQLNKDIISHYDSIFEKNTFYHPLAIQRGYKRWKLVQNNIAKFEEAIKKLRLSTSG
jgi:hypothetical protein